MTGFTRQSIDQLFSHLSIRKQIYGQFPDQPATRVVYDSREVLPGSIFVALQGGNTDGHLYIPQAIEKGASVIVGSAPPPVNTDVPYVQVEDSRLALGLLSAALYHFPARQLTVIGVTGTDGKTTTANLLYHILIAAGLPAGIISTVNARVGNEIIDTGFHVTTPEAPDLQRILNRMVVAGLSHVVLEVTSHGLAQQRVAGCEFDIGVITNITHEHLDFHKTYEEYRAAKAKLFTGLAETNPKRMSPPRMAVLNRDDSSFDYLRSVTTVPVSTYSIRTNEGEVWIDSIRYEASGTFFTAHGSRFAQEFQSNLVGDYNLSNCAAAIATAVVGLGISPEVVRQGILEMRGVPGRMERVDMGQKFTAIVDFAHTPNALLNSLQTVRRMTNGKVIAVFGSAGLRDREKRRMMAEVSTRWADYSIFTAEDPRTEPVEAILNEMAAGANAAGGEKGNTYWLIPDRREALRAAVKMAGEGDIVIACGKGHEQSMCFGTVEYPWDDRLAMRCALAELLGAACEPMPYLPDTL
ncbi:MAG TPA: UDP-N-acetylmuramoyl-L-alanyl-D-glutamate--2,6-diaminopimelate ligase [Anaerolineaceae bacterium]